MRFTENHLVVKAEFLSKGRRYSTEALIDTGTTVTVIPPEIADYLLLETDKKRLTIKMITGTGVIEVPRKIVPRIVINGIIFNNIAAGIHKVPDPIDTKVLIGMNILEHITLIIKGKEKSFELLR